MIIYIDLTEFDRFLKELDDGPEAVGEGDLRQIILLLQRLNLLPEEAVVVARQVVELVEAPVLVVV